MADGFNGNNKNRINPWLVGIGGLGINGLIVIINLVASSGYTTRSDFDVLKKEFQDYKLQIQSEMSHAREDQITKLGEIAGGIKELNNKMQDNVRQDNQIKDHEERVRALEEKSRK